MSAAIEFKVMRFRKEYDAAEGKWVRIGTAVVNADGQSGSIYLNHLDEVWRLFPRVEKVRGTQ